MLAAPRYLPWSAENLRNLCGLKARLARLTRDTDLAADLLQDAVVTALEKLDSGRLQRIGELDGYIYRVALNHLRNHRRKNRLRLAKSVVLGTLTDCSTDVFAESLDDREIARYMKELLREINPPRDREILARFYLEEESKEQICRLLELSDLHFNRVISRARERFKTLLGRHGIAKADLLPGEPVGITVCHPGRAPAQIPCD